MKPPVSAPSLSRRVRVETPEHVRLGYDLADLGSRFAAMVVDGVLVIGAFAFLLLVLAFVAGFGIPEYATGTLMAVLIFVLFLFQWGYFLLFEAFHDGRTPGKRLLGLRVVHSGGQPLSLQGAVLRNLVRFVDLQPFPTGVLGGAFMMFGRRTQRLGDLAADTIVVRDRGSGDVPWPDPGKPAPGRPLLQDEQFALLASFAARQARLPDAARARVAGSVLAALRPQAEAHPDFGSMSPLDFLRRLHADEAPRHAGGAIRWDLQAAALVRERKQSWDDYRRRVEEAAKRSLRSLSEREVRSFGRLYRAVAADLERARTYGAPPPVLSALEKWAGAGHNLLYRAKRRPRKSARRWLADGLPASVRSRRWNVLLAGLLLFGPMAATYRAVRADPALARSIMPAEMATRAENTTPGDIDAAYVEVPGAAMPMFSSAIMTNNLQVAFIAFAGGILAGIGTAAILVVNGVYLGAAFGLYANQGVLGVLLAFVSPHGVLELTAICLAGGAGFGLATGLLMPGRRTRRAALAARGREALSILGGAAVLLVVAGVVEGFFSPSALPAWAKFLFGGSTAVLLATYFANRASATAVPAP